MPIFTQSESQVYIFNLTFCDGRKLQHHNFSKNFLVIFYNICPKNFDILICHGPNDSSYKRVFIFMLSFISDDKCRLVVEYEHQLLSVAMSLTTGPFGGGREKDFVCVQFIDGTLLFLEQELCSFTRILTNRLQHEPLIYLEANDVFVTQNADWVLAFYR